MDYYHVLNRGATKQDIVHDDGDRQRFVKSLYVFNDKRNVPNGITQQSQWLDTSRQRTLLVHIHAWCLMNNHYHLLLSPVNDDPSNISLFMKKLNAGYAKFMNEKYEDHVGSLWQGKYKKILIEQDSHFLYIPYYIHLNPLDYKLPNWRVGDVSDCEKALRELQNYRWSSYLDYQSKNNFPSLITKQSIGDLLDSPTAQTKTICRIITVTPDRVDHQEASEALE